MAKIMPLEELKASTEKQLGDALLHAESMKGGVSNLKELLQRMVKERRVLKELRKQCSRMGVSSGCANKLLNEQLYEMEQVRNRKDGIQAQYNKAMTYAWEYKSIIEHFSDMQYKTKELSSEIKALGDYHNP